MRLAVITTCRSDYSPLFWVIKQLRNRPDVDLKIYVGGSHVAGDFGRTFDEIASDGFQFDLVSKPRERVDRDGTEIGDLHGELLATLVRKLREDQPSALIIYGDRCELLPICTAAVLTGIPVVHICGGEITEGSSDDYVRHAVTKLSHLHLVASQRSCEVVLQLGEDPDRIFIVGDPVLDHFVHGSSASLEELTGVLGFSPDERTLLVCLHPSLYEGPPPSQQVRLIIEAIECSEYRVVWTSPGPDPGWHEIRTAAVQACTANEGWTYFDSLGGHFYRGLLRHCGAMVGNSSSGLIEAGLFGLPVVNIGNRQLGRERGMNVLDSDFDPGSIREAIGRASSETFRRSLKVGLSPVGDGYAAIRISEILSEKRLVEISGRKIFRRMTFSPEVHRL